MSISWPYVLLWEWKWLKNCPFREKFVLLGLQILAMWIIIITNKQLNFGLQLQLTETAVWWCEYNFFSDPKLMSYIKFIHVMLECDLLLWILNSVHWYNDWNLCTINLKCRLVKNSQIFQLTIYKVLMMNNWWIFYG